MMVAYAPAITSFAQSGPNGYQDKNGDIKPELVKRGKVLYAKHCVGCHGEKGDGKGPAAYGLDPKPRDFTEAIFKFRSTKTGSIPTDEDIERSIRDGVPGTSMPAFRLFSDNEITALAHYIKVFDTKDSWAQPIQRAQLDPIPNWMFAKDEWLDHAAKGKATYDLTCATCHGATGLGDGVGGKGLKDIWGHPVKPANLQKATDIGSGPKLEDAFRAITTGTSLASPMVGYGDVFTSEQRWELVAFIKYLRDSRKNPELKLPEVTDNTNQAEENEFE